MPELFSSEWMQSYATAWNAEPDLSEALARNQFQSTIVYGFKKMTHPQGVLVIEQGRSFTKSFTVMGQVLSGQNTSREILR